MVVALLGLLLAQVQAQPSQFPSGVTNVQPTHPLSEMGQLDPAQFHDFWEDFNYYDSAEWTVTTTEGGSGTASEAIQDADGGVLKVTNDDFSTDNDYLQFGSETLLMESGKKTWFTSRWKASNATNSTLHMGMMITDTSPADVSEGVYFRIDGDGNLDVYVEEENSAKSASAVYSVTDDTYVTTSWYYNGVDEVQYFVDGVQRGTISVADSDMPLDTADDHLTQSFGVANGANETQSISVDYVGTFKER
jgi:hypothetical protein